MSKKKEQKCALFKLFLVISHSENDKFNKIKQKR